MRASKKHLVINLIKYVKHLKKENYKTIEEKKLKKTLEDGKISHA
jgi:hypothetical protein